jgi:hypothetical protein
VTATERSEEAGLILILIEDLLDLEVDLDLDLSHAALAVGRRDHDHGQVCWTAEGRSVAPLHILRRRSRLCGLRYLCAV